MTQIIILKGCFCTIYAPIDAFISEVFIDYLLCPKRLGAGDPQNYKSMNSILNSESGKEKGRYQEGLVFSDQLPEPCIIESQR